MEPSTHHDRATSRTRIRRRRMRGVGRKMTTNGNKQKFRINSFIHK